MSLSEVRECVTDKSRNHYGLHMQTAVWRRGHKTHAQTDARTQRQHHILCKYVNMGARTPHTSHVRARGFYARFRPTNRLTRVYSFTAYLRGACARAYMRVSPRRQRAQIIFPAVSACVLYHFKCDGVAVVVLGTLVACVRVQTHQWCVEIGFPFVISINVCACVCAYDLMQFGRPERDIERDDLLIYAAHFVLCARH